MHSSTQSNIQLDGVGCWPSCKDGKNLVLFENFHKAIGTSYQIHKIFIITSISSSSLSSLVVLLKFCVALVDHWWHCDWFSLIHVTFSSSRLSHTSHQLDASSLCLALPLLSVSSWYFFYIILQCYICLCLSWYAMMDTLDILTKTWEKAFDKRCQISKRHMCNISALNCTRTSSQIFPTTFKLTEFPNLIYLRSFVTLRQTPR